MSKFLGLLALILLAVLAIVGVLGALILSMAFGAALCLLGIPLLILATPLVLIGFRDEMKKAMTKAGAKIEKTSPKEL